MGAYFHALVTDVTRGEDGGEDRLADGDADAGGLGVDAADEGRLSWLKRGRHRLCEGGDARRGRTAGRR